MSKIFTTCVAAIATRAVATMAPLKARIADVTKPIVGPYRRHAFIPAPFPRRDRGVGRRDRQPPASWGNPNLW